MFDSPWIAASNREVLITAPTFSNGWSTTAAAWKIHKSLYTKNPIVSLILNQDNPPPTSITAESITQQSRRTLCDVQLDDYKDDINKALAERRTTERPKMCNKRIFQQLNERTNDLQTNTLTQSPRKRPFAEEHNPLNARHPIFTLATRTKIHTAAAKIYHQHHTHGQTNT